MSWGWRGVPLGDLWSIINNLYKFIQILFKITYFKGREFRSKIHGDKLSLKMKDKQKPTQKMIISFGGDKLPSKGVLVKYFCFNTISKDIWIVTYHISI